MYRCFWCLADERSDGADDAHEKFGTSENVRGDTKSGCFRVLLPSVSLAETLHDDHADDASQQQDGAQGEHQESLSGERVWLVADGDDENDECDEDADADAGFVHVDLGLADVANQIVGRPGISVSLVKTQGDRAKNNGQDGNDGHNVDFDSRHG